MNGAVRILCGLMLAFLLGWPRPLQGDPPVFVVLGDSFTSGYRLLPGQGFAETLERSIQKRPCSLRVINRSVPGSNARQGLRRLDAVLKMKPAIVLVEFGTNDIVQGRPLRVIRANLEEIIVRLERAGIAVALAGIVIPKTAGIPLPDAEKAPPGPIAAMYRGLAAEHGIVLYPNIMEGVHGDGAALINDRFHPNAEGVQRMVARILPALSPLVRRVCPNY